MINDYPPFAGAPSNTKSREMESRPVVQQCNKGSNGRASRVCVQNANCAVLLPADGVLTASEAPVCVAFAPRRAHLSAPQGAPCLSVIFASQASIVRPLPCPSFKGWWSTMLGQERSPISRSSKDPLPPLSFPFSSSPSTPTCLFLIAPAISTDNVMLSNSNNSKLVYNENNMQSVNFSLSLEHLCATKGIVNDNLMSVSVLCVPQSFKDNCNYSTIATVTEPMIQRNDTTADADEITFGAFLRVHDEIQSQCFIEIVDNNLYYNLIVKQINQINGGKPNDCIPVMINAITEQGISYRVGPHSRSFNLINTRVMNGGLHRHNKSDYPSKISNCIMMEENPSIKSRKPVPEGRVEEDIIYAKQLPDDKVNIVIEIGSNTFINSVRYVHLDNKYINVTVKVEMRNDNANGQQEMKRGTDCAFVERFKDGQPTFASLLKGVLKMQSSSYLNTGFGAPQQLLRRSLRLCGGGESSLNTTGWGSPPSSNNGNAGNWGNVGQGGSSNGPANASQQWGSAQRPPASQADVNSNKGSGSQNSMPPSSGSSGVTPGTPGIPNAGWPSQPPQTINSMNGSNSNQSGNSGGNNSPSGTNSGNGSPSGNNSSGSSIPNSAKIQLEQLNNMRETLFSQDGWGGQHVNQDTNWDVPGSPEPGTKVDQPGGGPPLWKPNINNGTDLWEANLRNGGQPPPPQTPKTPWGHTPTTNIGGTWGEDDEPSDAANVWTGPPPIQQWGGAGPPPQPPNWAKKDDWQAWGEPNMPPDIYPPDIHRPDMRRTDPHDPRDPRDPRYSRLPDLRDLKDLERMRGDPRGISGRLNGSLNQPDSWSLRGGPPPAKLMQTHGTKPGWEEPSPPAQRRAVPAYDDGSWQRGSQRPPTHAAPQGRLPSGPVKPDALWMQPPRNGSWDEGPSHTGGWDKDSTTGWNDGPVNPGWGGPKPKPGPGGWDSDVPNWGHKPPSTGPPAKMLPKDTIWNSKQFQVLVGMGYKKDEVEEALRSRNMNLEEAAELLSQMRGGGAMDAWRRHEEHGGPPFDHQPPYPPQQRPHHSFPPQQPPAVPYPQVNISPAIAQKILNQATSQPPPPFNQPSSQSGGTQPCTTQLRQLVQQIQMAVSNGFLNHQILNQPLAPHTLLLLNQLLQQIKSLHQLASQQNMIQNNVGNGGKTNSAAVLQISVQITKTKQQIHNLQNQITAQQAIYLKQQASGSSGGNSSSSADFYNKQQNHDPLAQLQNNFTDISLGKDPQSAYGGVGGVGAGSQQSRLNQWKLPALDKDSDDFSRAPGSVAKSATSPLSGLANSDGPWGPSGRGGDAWGGVEADLTDGKDSWPVSSHQTTPAYTDLVPEFEPGKPWKMKIIEDDPAITPGSVVRSPLSLAGMKDSELFGAGKSSPASTERSLSSSTWSYSAGNGSGVSAPFKPTPNAAGKGWGESEWGKRTQQSSGLKGAVGGLPWSAHQPAAIRPTQQHQHSWQSTWLLLKNLTAQIDGSTLKTLCMQHGPLQSFHLYLTQGIALAKYSSGEEANKAQTALNNCVLGNTTIFAEAPGDSDVNMILQHLGQGGGGGQWRGGAGGGGGAPQSKPEPAWSYAGSLWGAASGPDDGQRATPSSLNSFLPPDLLGGESV